MCGGGPVSTNWQLLVANHVQGQSTVFFPPYIRQGGINRQDRADPSQTGSSSPVSVPSIGGWTADVCAAAISCLFSHHVTFNTSDEKISKAFLIDDILSGALESHER
jgi:hypothetical protein